MSDSSPKVTVLMPVYNGEAHLHDAVTSILTQTFADFEFLIINDCSTDRSVEIIDSFKDRRIRLVHNERNQRVPATLNRGLELARGKYVARMDCDDISTPERLGKQVEFMDSHPEIGICGSWMRIFDGRSEVITYPQDPAVIQCKLLFWCMFSHPSVIMRRDLLRDRGISYDAGYTDAEDYELWVRCSRLMKMSNIQEILLLYRWHERQISSSRVHVQQDTALRISLEQLGRLGIVPAPDEIEIHSMIMQQRLEESADFIGRAGKWLLRIKTANNQSGYYPEPYFSAMIRELWERICFAQKHLDRATSRVIRRSELSYTGTMRQKWKFWKRLVKASLS